MTVLSVAQQASSVIGVSRPTALFAATDDTSIQIQDCLNETAAMIAFDSGHDWTKLATLATVTGDGVATTFSFPTNYKRMLKKSRLWPSSSPYSTLTHYTDIDTWLGITVQNFTPIIGGWTIIGTKLNILPILGSGNTVKFYYMANTPVAANDSTAKTSFTADDDTFPIGERLLRLAFIAKWKQDRGQDYGEAMADYQTSLSQHIGDDKGSRRIVLGEQRYPGMDAEFAWPYSLGS